MKKIVIALMLASFAALWASADDEDFIKAAGKGDLAAAERYLKAGVKVNEARDDGGYNMMTMGETALIIASTNGDLKMVRLLLKYKADPNVTNEGYSALYYAAEGGRCEVVKALVEAGARVNDAIPDGYTPLMGAAGSSNKETVRYLLSKGADRRAKDSEGRLAADYAKDPAVKALLE